MKSNKRRRVELKAKKARKQLERLFAERVKPIPPNAASCNSALLAPTTSYSIVDFVYRGYYLDKPFTCIDCGKSEVWTASQQKWWYEVAKGAVWTTARRCRNCRRKERERKTEARRVHVEGLERKNVNRPAKA
jgi:Probable zinc-ribbon domain